MLLEIKKVRKCRNNAYGNYTIIGHGKARITISLKKNPTLAEYGATVLHEMLHAFVTLLRVEGFKVTNKKEHIFIYACEEAVLKVMKKTLKGGK